MNIAAAPVSIVRAVADCHEVFPEPSELKIWPFPPLDGGRLNVTAVESDPDWTPIVTLPDEPEPLNASVPAVPLFAPRTGAGVAVTVFAVSAEKIVPANAVLGIVAVDHDALPDPSERSAEPLAPFVAGKLNAVVPAAAWAPIVIEPLVAPANTSEPPATPFAPSVGEYVPAIVLAEAAART